MLRRVRGGWRLGCGLQWGAWLRRWLRRGILRVGVILEEGERDLVLESYWGVLILEDAGKRSGFESC